MRRDPANAQRPAMSAKQMLLTLCATLCLVLASGAVLVAPAVDRVTVERGLEVFSPGEWAGASFVAGQGQNGNFQSPAAYDIDALIQMHRAAARGLAAAASVNACRREGRQPQ